MPALRRRLRLLPTSHLQQTATPTSASVPANPAALTIDVAGAEIVAANRRIEAGSTGTVMGKNDIWIAATAMITGPPLVTTDRDFNHLDGKLLEVKFVDPKLGSSGP